MLQIRAMAAADVAFAVSQATREGWASSRGQFETWLAHDPGGCFVAEENGQPVGMVTTTRYHHTAFIGNLIVEPGFRSRGIGRALMLRGLAHLESQGISTVRLDGDPPGMPLYRSLGFEGEWESLRFTGRGTEQPSPRAVFSLTGTDLPRVAGLDAAAFADDRCALLRLQLEHSWRAFMTEEDGDVTGFVISEATNLGVRVGPWVARTTEVACRLLAAIRASVGSDGTLMVGVPDGNNDACALLEASGFVRTAPSLRMVRGPTRAAGQLQLVYGIGGGAVG